MTKERATQTATEVDNKDRASAPALSDLNRDLDRLQKEFRAVLRDRDRVVALAYGPSNLKDQEIEHLKTEQQRLSQTVLWYQQKVRELLLSQYSFNDIAERLRLLSEQERLLIEERERLLGEITRLRRYSPDALPRVIALPLKLVLALFVKMFSPFRAK